MRNVWFYRNYQGFTGGHLKHSHYFNNVRSLTEFNTKIYFPVQSYSADRHSQMVDLWGQGDNIALQWCPLNQDIIFLAGMDWSFALAKGGLNSSMPRLNLIQGVRHAEPDQPLYAYLTEPAIRICVSQPVADAIMGTGKVCGPVVVIPNGTDFQPVQGMAPIHNGFNRVQIIGYKMPDFARTLMHTLSAAGIPTELLLDVLPRDEFFARLDPSALIVCCPLPREGFYLTALEAMAKGCFVVMPDCEGNRAYAIDGINCFFPSYQLEAISEAVLRAMHLPHAEIEKIRAASVVTATKHTLENERFEFYKLLNDIDRLWQEI